ncbi:MAG: PpiC-type peptidyl-prolyl cis-trans isomerase [Acidobacteriales bacterium]|nr:PpiC-type peptidyl-prolyl cis-trans isomerase [Terriglobales bacterium]
MPHYFVEYLHPIPRLLQPQLGWRLMSQFSGGNLQNIRSYTRRSIAGLLFPSLLVLTAFSGCNRNESSGDALARVNGEKILRADVDKYYANQTAGSPQQPVGEQADSLRLNILKQLIDDEIMMQRARKLGLLATDEEVDAKFTEFKSPYTQEEFDKRLKEKNVTLDDFKRDLRRGLTVEKVFNKEVTSKINITDGDITKYYNEHKAEFNLIEPQFHLAQIVVTTSPAPVNNGKNDKAQNEPEAKKKIQMLMNRIESGEDFSTVAMNYSEQTNTSTNGGDMGFIPESSLKADLQAMQAISKLKIGQNTEPIPAYGEGHKLVGYRIVKLIAREPAGQRELADPRVQGNIRQQLRDRREQLLRAAYYEVVRNEAKVENYLADELLKNTGAATKK